MQWAFFVLKNLSMGFAPADMGSPAVNDRQGFQLVWVGRAFYARYGAMAYGLFIWLA
jgi:hypothetical protein